MNYDEYRSIPAVNFSSLKHIDKSPRHYRHALQQPPADAAHFAMGRAVHTLVFEPDKFASEYVRMDLDGRTKAGKEFVDKYADKTILKAPEFDTVQAIANAVTSDPIAGKYVSAGLREATIQWQDEHTGIECKGRVDCVGRHLVDLKTTANLDERKWVRAVVDYHYHVQSAFYLDGLAANGVEVDPEPIHIAVEKTAPHDVVVYRLPEHVVELGRSTYRRWLERLVECKMHDRWPGRAEQEQELVLPEWCYVDDEPLDLVIDGDVVAI